MAAKWLYSVDREGVRITPDFMERLRSGDAAALRALKKANLTLLFRKEFTRAPRRNDAHGLFWSVPETTLIPFIRAGRHSPAAWVKADVLVETIKAKKNTYEPPKQLERGKKRMVSFVQAVRKDMKRGEETVLMNINAGGVSAWKMVPNPKFELVVVNRFDKAVLLKLLDELDSAANVTLWLKERTVRQGLNRSTLDYLFITNADQDHMSDLKGLEQEGIFVDTLFRNPTYSGSEMYAIKSISGPVSADAQWYVQACSAYNTPTNLPFNTNMGGITARCFFNPYPQFTDTNDLSLVVFIEFAGFKILFPGDLEKAGWQALLQRADFRAALYGTNILVASHHGRESGFCQSAIRSMPPSRRRNGPSVPDRSSSTLKVARSPAKATASCRSRRNQWRS